MSAPPAVVGRYQLLDLLATGGMGEVYVARQRSSIDAFVKLVAVKLLPEASTEHQPMVEMFLAEARAAARIHHRNIVQILDVDQHDGRYFQAMEYIPGWTLRELLGMRSITDERWMPLRAIVRMFTELAEALAKAHDGGLIHRDVSPSNIMVSEAGVPKLIDFGIARGLDDIGLTQPGTLKGKYAYMAPEYIRGLAYDHRVDLFALGIVLWETLTRTKLFRGNNAADLLLRVLESPVPDLAQAPYHLPPGIAAVVATALERDPDRRFNSAHAMATALERAERDLPPTDETASLARWLVDTIPEELAQLREREAVWHATPAITGASESGRGAALGVGEGAGRAGTVTRNLQPASRSRSASGDAPAPLPRFDNSVPSQSIPSATSLALASGAPQPAPTAAVAPRRRWGVAVGLVGAIAVAAVVGWQLKRPAPSPPPASPPAEPAAMAPAREAEVHRKLAVAAMNDRDWARARGELQAAVELIGATDELSRTLQIVDELEKGAAATDVAQAEPSPAGPPPDDLPSTAAPATTPATRAATRGAHPATRAAAASEAHAEARPAAAAAGLLVVTSNVAGLIVLVDGKPAGVTPFRGRYDRGVHQVAVSDGRRLIENRVVDLREELATMDVAAVAPPPAVAPPSPPPTAPVEPVKPPPPVAIDAGVAAPVRAARTPRVAAATLGDARSGAGAVGAACNGCHQERGVAAVSGGRKTAEQWTSFFANGRHDDFERLGDRVTAGQLAAIKAFLIANSHGARDCGIAGMKECN